VPSRVPPNSSLLFEVEVLRVSTLAKLQMVEVNLFTVCHALGFNYLMSFLLQIKSNRETTDSPVTIQEPVASQSADQLPDILSEPSGTRKRSTDSQLRYQ